MTFKNCDRCGCLCYTDGFGDDVIPAGYYNNEGEFLCAYCNDFDDEELIEQEQEK